MDPNKLNFKEKASAENLTNVRRSSERSICYPTVIFNEFNKFLTEVGYKINQAAEIKIG